MDSDNVELRRPALYIVGTPIGNLADFSVRGQQVLRSVDVVLVEDTRKSRYLLERYQIENKMISYHDFSGTERVAEILKTIVEKPVAIALISDSGTPLISDPGFKLVKRVIAAEIPIIPIPGASALVACLSISDLPIDKFVFEGFLPPKDAGRTQRLKDLKAEQRSMIFYEAPHRILKFLKSIETVMGGDRQLVVARELTKVHETIYRGSVFEVLRLLNEHSSARKGEFTLIVEGALEPKNEAESQVDTWLRVLLEDLDIKTSVKIVGKITKAKRNLIYKRALDIAKYL